MCCITRCLCHDSLWPPPSRDAPAHGCGIWSSLRWELSSQPRYCTNPRSVPTLAPASCTSMVGSSLGPGTCMWNTGHNSGSPGSVSVTILSSALCTGFSFQSKLQTHERGTELTRTTAPLRCVTVENVIPNTEANPTLSTGDGAPCPAKGEPGGLPDHLKPILLSTPRERN